MTTKYLDMQLFNTRKADLARLVATFEQGIAESQKRIVEYGQALQLAKGRLAQLAEVEQWLAEADPGDNYADLDSESDPYTDEELEELTAPPAPVKPLLDVPEPGTPGYVRPKLTQHRGK